MSKSYIYNLLLSLDQTANTVFIITLLLLSGCSSVSYTDSEIESTNPAAIDYCQRNTSSVLCRTE